MEDIPLVSVRHLRVPGPCFRSEVKSINVLFEGQSLEHVEPKIKMDGKERESEKRRGEGRTDGEEEGKSQTAPSKTTPHALYTLPRITLTPTTHPPHPSLKHSASRRAFGCGFLYRENLHLTQALQILLGWKSFWPTTLGLWHGCSLMGRKLQFIQSSTTCHT
jgi:hypothetical protein